jgi:putative transposase
MNCPHCAAAATRKRATKTKLGYLTFFCSKCKHIFNERTGAPFNYLEFPTDIVLLVVFWRLRYKLSLRDLAEMFLARGFSFTHETVRDWEAQFAPLIADQLRTKRCGQAGKSWYVDETYLKVHGKWCYLYRAIDADGRLVDSRLSEQRDMDAAQRFFEQALAVVGHAPDHSRLRLAFVVPLMNYATISAIVNIWEKRSRSQNSVTHFVSGSRFCKRF